MFHSVLFDQVDLSILLSLNHLLAGSNVKLKILDQIGNNPLIRGSPIFFALVSIWFIANSIEARSRILVGVLASCLATGISVSLQEHWTPHLRPLLDTSLPLNLVGVARIEDWHGRLGSFPSDTASLYFSLCAVIFLQRRSMGLLCLLWALVTVGVARIALGWHYPSDIVGGLLLGPTVVFLLSRPEWPRRIGASFLRKFEGREYIVHSIYFLLLADAYYLFPGLQDIYRITKKTIAMMFSF